MSGVYERLDDLTSSWQGNGSSWTPFFLDIIRPCVAEFLAMAMFTFLGTLCVLAAPDMTNPLSGVLLNALGAGMTIAVLMIMFGVISMCHLNPVVTLAFFLCGHIRFVKGLAFIIAQLLGSIFGSLCIRGVLGKEIFSLLKGGAQLLPADVTQMQGVMCEVSLTFALILAILLISVEHEEALMAPVGIGCLVVVAVMAGSTVSGPSMNPGRSFGPAVVATWCGVGSGVWDDHYIYWLGPTVGTLLATFFFLTVMAGSDKRICARRHRYVQRT